MMNNLNLKQNKTSQFHRLKNLLLITFIVFISRYLILMFYVIWIDSAIINNIPILFLFQIALSIFGFTFFCYGLFSIREYIIKPKIKKLMRIVVITLLAMTLLLIVIIFTWMITSFIPITESFPYELWVESLVIAMPFAELIPLTIALIILSICFWMLGKEKGWNTNLLKTPIFLLPLTIIRLFAAFLKIINIIDSTKFQVAWKMADITRIIYSILGVVIFIEIFIQISKIKTEIIISNITSK